MANQTRDRSMTLYQLILCWLICNEVFFLHKAGLLKTFR